MELLITLASPDFADYYHPSALSPTDLMRRHKKPQKDHNPDWRSSRALKAHLRRYCLTRRYCLSHHQGYAASVSSRQHVSLGIDVQIMQPKSFAQLLPIFTTSDEQLWWSLQPQANLAYYQLWTLKEALIKATNLNFPGDLRNVGIFRQPDGTWAVRSPNPENEFHARWWSPRVDMVLCCVWPAPNDVVFRYDFCGTATWQQPMPQYRL